MSEVWVEDPTAPNNGPKVNAAVWSLFSAATVFLGLRVYCKFRRHRGLWWDDYVLLASWICFLVGCIQLSVNIAYGFGKPGANINPAHMYQVGLGGLVVGAMVMIAPIWSKTSFVLTLTKISGPRLKIVLWFIAASMNAFQAAALIVQFAQCTPLEKVWNPFLPRGSCWSPDINLGFSMGSAAYSGLMDLTLAALPWLILKDLQIKKKEKLGIAFAMSLGVIAAAAAFVKVGKLKILASSDFTLEGGELIIWAATDITATTIAACVPVLRTLIREVSTNKVSGPSGGYFKSGSGIDRAQRSRMNRSNVISVTAKSRGEDDGYNKNATVVVTHDAASDKSILQAGHSRIMKTEEIAVSFEDRGDEGSMGYEMKDIR